jgi:hypothetical protein
MDFQDTDIKFDKINWIQFEELCFDLLLKYQFHSLNWRQGGADKGRDIEAVFTNSNSLIGAYPEKWFIECKHYSSGIPINQIANKIDWAVAEKADHFVLFTNKYPTVATKEFIKLRQAQVEFPIHVFDGKLLKQKLLPFPDLLVKYFADDTTVLVKNILKQWLFHDIMPDLKTLFKLSKLIDPRKLNKEELVFLYYAFEQSDYDEDFLVDDVEEFSYDFLFSFITANTNSKFPMASAKMEFGDDNIYRATSIAQTRSDIPGYLVWHYLKEVEGNNMAEVFLKRENMQITVEIAVGSMTQFKKEEARATPKIKFKR